MPGPTKRRKYHHGITTEKKKYRTKRRTRDIDQIVQDIEEISRKKPEEIEKPVDLDLPGGGQFHCLHCAKYFIDKHALDEHCRGKVHKKRVKETLEIPYSVEESEKAGGLGSYEPPPSKKSRRVQDSIDIS